MENKARILVVDDEESIRFTFETFLADEGYSVATAQNYDEAMALFAGSGFDLVFADILLGGGRTGIDLMREARKLSLDCPFVVVTGAPNVETASEAVRLGAFDYIAKPVHQGTLVRVAKMALRNKELNDEKEKYRLNLEAIFGSVKDAIITVDEDLRVVELNRAAEKICGVSREAIGRPFNSIDGGCKKNCLDAFVETISKKKPVEMFNIECHHKNRSGHVVSLSTSPLLDHQGLFSGAVIVIRDETRLYDLERDLKERRQFHNMIGTGEKMQEIYSLIENLADVQTTVLITGESGTGKELAAEALHYKGIRSHKPLVKVNCSALSEGLLESELFGHVKGAFTGAVKDKVGRFQRADKGTIFLDEIGDVSPRIQLRLLRVLQDMEFERVGDSAPIKVDVRVIAATNQDLSAKISRGEFREDLFYRLKVVEINIPSLRDRREDIPFLIEHFIEKFNKKLDKDIKAVSADVQKIFMEYPWPGNIREFEHTLEHAFILCRQNTITLDHLPGNIRNSSAVRAPAHRHTEGDETQRILQALEKTGGNKAKAARMLGFDRKTLYRKIERLNIPKKRD
jgi:two-component system response regulator HydG